MTAPLAHPLEPRPTSATLAPAIRWFLLHLVASGLDLEDAQATVEQAARAEADALRRAGVR